MSQVAALLLMFLPSDEDAFWGLHRLMVEDKFNMHAFFIPSFPKLQRFKDIHDKVGGFPKSLTVANTMFYQKFFLSILTNKKVFAKKWDKPILKIGQNIFSPN